jgi:hypothetical protein
LRSPGSSTVASSMPRMAFSTRVRPVGEHFIVQGLRPSGG